MYELDCYIILIRHTGFNPFRLAAAIASCSPPSPVSGDGSYDDRAFSAALRFKFLRTYATNNGIRSFSREIFGWKGTFSEAGVALAVAAGVPRGDSET